MVVFKYKPCNAEQQDPQSLTVTMVVFKLGVPFEDVEKMISLTVTMVVFKYCTECGRDIQRLV